MVLFRTSFRAASCVRVLLAASLSRKSCNAI
jgi:hypothetical protein